VASARRPSAIPAWLTAALLAAGLAWNGRAMALKIERAPFRHPDLRSEPVIDRARIAARVREGLIAAAPLQAERLVFWSPETRTMFATPEDDRESYGERNVRTALYDGLGVRLMAPGVREVEFATSIDPADSATYAIYDLTGRTRVFGAAELREQLFGTPAPSTAR
jgi:hypothetical protein